MKFDPDAYGHVYLVTNIINGKRYVGQTTGRPDQRWQQGHVRAARFLPDVKMPIVCAIRKYGEAAFTREIVSRAVTQEELNAQELTAAIKYRTFAPQGYNLRAGDGYGSMSVELRARLSRNFPEDLKAKFREQYAGRRWSDLAYRRSAEATQVTYRVRNPAGDLMVITNFRQFASQVPDLDAGLLQSVARGRRWRHREWFIATEEIWSTADSLGDRSFRCPRCNVEWVSLSQRHANVHVTSCHRKAVMLQAAFDLGNITEDELLWQVQLLDTPHIMVKTRTPIKRIYVVVSPIGARHTIDNMRRFCAANGLNPAKMSRLVNGLANSHRGWTGAAE